MPVSQEDLDKVRAFARKEAAEAAELRRVVKFLERDNKRLQRGLNRIYSSWTWRVGRVVLFPIHLAQWVLAELRQRSQ